LRPQDLPDFHPQLRRNWIYNNNNNNNNNHHHHHHIIIIIIIIIEISERKRVPSGKIS
jgi:hypothetical protein